MENIELLPCGSLVKCRPSDALSSFYDFACFVRACEPSKVLHLLAKTQVRPSAQRVQSPARSHLKKQRKRGKSQPKSTQDRGKLPVGLARTALSLDFGRSEDSSERSDAAKLARNGRIGPATTPSLDVACRNLLAGRPRWVISL